jgi:hypothetical protein
MPWPPAPGAKQARDDAFEKMFLEQEKLKRDMQGLVDALAGTIDAKVALALSNGFQVEDFGVINKQDFVVVDGPVSGTVKQVAKGVRDASFHEWGSSVDNGVTWDYIEPTIQASRISEGFTPGSKIKFRHRMFTRKGPQDYHYFDLIIR